MTIEALSIYDKTGRVIEVGDILKVYHFTARQRRRRVYMYKQVVEEKELGRAENRSPYLFISHLSPCGAGYHLPLDGAHHPDIEIVHSFGSHYYDRPRVILPITPTETA